MFAKIKLITMKKVFALFAITLLSVGILLGSLTAGVLGSLLITVVAKIQKR